VPQGGGDEIMKQLQVRSWFCYSLVPPVAFALFGSSHDSKLAWFLSGLTSSPALWLIARRIFTWFFPVVQMGPASPLPSRHGRLGYRGQMRRARAR
jgi:hypothetical protein